MVKWFQNGYRPKSDSCLRFLRWQPVLFFPIDGALILLFPIDSALILLFPIEETLKIIFEFGQYFLKYSRLQRYFCTLREDSDRDRKLGVHNQFKCSTRTR